MRSSFLLLPILAACTFNARGAGGDSSDDPVFTDASPIDASPIDAEPPDASIDAPPPPICIGTGLLEVCGLATDATSVTLGATFDTTDDPLCSELVTGAQDACVVWATELEIPQNVRVTGTKPLILAAIVAITSDANINASSTSTFLGPGANPTSCAVMTHPEDDDGGAGGGAGGSFHGAGGKGGTGDDIEDDTGLGGLPSDGSAALMELRGGCPGDQGGDETNEHLGGLGGGGGGAIALLSNGPIMIGHINVAGAGGLGGVWGSGGGGGGSGGSIVLEGSSVVVGSGLYANGGGGGAGAWRYLGYHEDGGAGANGYTATSRAAGGAAGVVQGDYAGDGGAGSALSLDGLAGESKRGGAGGGGGGAGFVYVHGTGGDTVVTSPPASTWPSP